MFEDNSYRQGQVDMLVALMQEPGIDNTNLRFRAYESRRFPKAVVDEAIEKYDEDNNSR